MLNASINGFLKAAKAKGLSDKEAKALVIRVMMLRGECPQEGKVPMKDIFDKKNNTTEQWTAPKDARLGRETNIMLNRLN